MQYIALTFSIIGIGLVTAAFVMVIKNSSIRDENYPEITAKAYSIRQWLMTSVCVIGIVVTAATLMPFPLHSSTASNPLVIKAKAGMWYWDLDATSAVVDKPIQFHVTSADVNHGFALYDPNDKMIAQTQAMPGYTNKLNVTFTETGTHRIMCLEYCGLAHHAMITEFEVTEENQ